MPNPGQNQQSDGGRISITNLKGVNERQQFNQTDPEEFDIVQGCIPTAQNSLIKLPGIRSLLNLPQSLQIRSICQTFDSRRNVIIQTNQDLRIVSENELFGLPPDPSSLTDTTLNEEDYMSICILTHSATAGTSGGATGVAAGTLTQRPLTDIVTQVDLNGSNPLFCTLASNQFTLQAGVYRFEGWVAAGLGATASAYSWATLWDVTNNVAAFNGQKNQYSVPRRMTATAGGISNLELHFIIGVLQPSSPNIYEIRQASSFGSGNASAFGATTYPSSVGPGVTELYAHIKITKTA